ncbi:unnamed protein product [Lactuca virosa]|uniref:Uncharacterized protein n=1 Tax=Lactuca virosa TaxID=75947 RepID=A0AAU9LMU0_9ASTR|nr:unnamed protein product [Lactuca virosa]
MFRDVPPSSKILEGYRTITPSGPRPLTDEFQEILAEADKAKKGGRGSKKATKKDSAKEGTSEAVKPPTKKRNTHSTSTAAPKRRKQPARRQKSPTPTPSQSEGEDYDSKIESEIRIEENPPVRTEEDAPIHTEEQEHVHNAEEEQVHTASPVRTEASSPNREITPPLNDFVPSPPSSLKRTTSIPITIEPLPPPVSSQPPITIPVSIPVFTDSTVLPQTSTSPAMTEKVNKLIVDTREFMEDYKDTYNATTTTTRKAIQNVGTMFQAEKTNFSELRKVFQSDHEAF